LNIICFTAGLLYRSKSRVRIVKIHRAWHRGTGASQARENLKGQEALLQDQDEPGNTTNEQNKSDSLYDDERRVSSSIEWSPIHKPESQGGLTKFQIQIFPRARAQGEFLLIEQPSSSCIQQILFSRPSFCSVFFLVIILCHVCE
jgi:hypothetical protein